MHAAKPDQRAFRAKSRRWQSRRPPHLATGTLTVGKQFPLSYTGDKGQRCLFEPRLKVIQTAGDSHHQNAAVAGEQSYHCFFVRQRPIAEPFAVARKFKGHLIESHAAEVGPVGCRDGRMSIERKALRQPAPADQHDAGTPRLFQRQPERFQGLISLQEGLHGWRACGDHLKIQQANIRISFVICNSSFKKQVHGPKCMRKKRKRVLHGPDPLIPSSSPTWETRLKFFPLFPSPLRHYV